jgi:hypothetical protein
LSFARVIDEIYNNFHKVDVKLERFKALPYGILVTDKNGDTVIFFLDIKTNTVKWFFPDKNRR